MEIRFVIDDVRFTLGDRIALEEIENIKWSSLRDVLSRSLVDANGNYVEYPVACKVLESLTTPQLNDAIELFRQTAEDMAKGSVPKASGSA